jgi:hypothetical protein
LVNEPQVGAGEKRLGGVEFVAQVADGLVVCGLSEMVQAHDQGVGWKIGNQIDFGLINLP